MRTTFLRLLILLVALVYGLVTSSSAEVVTTVSVGGGYQGNLFNDSLSIGESYSSVGGDIKFYPSSSLRLAGEGTYSAYSSTRDLSNFSGGTSIMFIPTGPSSPLSVMLVGQMFYRSMGRLYELYNRSNVGASGIVGYRLLKSLQLESRVSYSGTNYINSDYGSNRGFEIAAGFNVTPFGSNAFALEVGYLSRTYDLARYDEAGNLGSSDGGITRSQQYESTGLSFRYSRPLGDRTGMSISMGHRWSHLDDALAVPGYTIDYLSPWAELWDGFSISTSLKHYFPGQVIVELSGAVYDKSFVDVIEGDDLSSESLLLISRQDDLVTSSITISKAISLGDKNLLTPSLSLGYIRSQSTLDYYDYDDFSANFALKMRF